MPKKKETRKENLEKASKFVTEYERGLLSLLIKKVDLFAFFKQTATGSYFLYPPHRLIFSALDSLYSNPDVKNIDFETLLAECNNLGFKNLGVGSDYLMILTEATADKNNFEFFLKKVKSAYLKYSLSEQLDIAQESLTRNSADDDSNKTGEELLQELNNEFAHLMSFQGDKEDGVNFADILDQFIKERKDNPTDVKGLRTGFHALDKAINGLLPGTLTIFAGVAGMGKSTALLNIADYLAVESAEAGPVLYISTEMSKEEDLSRLLAIRTTYPERTITNGTIFHDPKKAEVLTKACKQIKKAKLFHIYTPDFNAAKICNYIYYYQKKYGIIAAIFDYIKLDTVDDKTLQRREDQILGDLTTSLKNMAGKLSIPILAGCQINSKSGKVADSDRIIRYCNNLIDIWEQTDEQIEEHGDIYKYGTHWFKIRKARSGPKEWIPIRFWKHCVKMVEAEVFKVQKDEDSLKDQLTTPDEYEEIRSKTFQVDMVAQISQISDLEDQDFEPEDSIDDRI